MTEAQKTQIYADFSPKVMGYILHKVDKRQLAEDLCADVFVKVYESLGTFDETKASLSTWIYTITRNTLIDYYRTHRVFDEVPETLTANESIEDDLIRDEMLEALADALEKLDVRQRDLILFHYYRGLTLKEIGERMGISYAYVKLLHNNALQNLRSGFLAHLQYEENE